MTGPSLVPVHRKAVVYNIDFDYVYQKRIFQNLFEGKMHRS